MEILKGLITIDNEKRSKALKEIIIQSELKSKKVKETKDFMKKIISR